MYALSAIEYCTHMSQFCETESHSSLNCTGLFYPFLEWNVARCVLRILRIVLLWMNKLLERGWCVPRSHIATNGFTVALLKQMLYSDICEQITHDQNPHCCILYTCVYVHTLYTCIYVRKNILQVIIMNDGERIKCYLNLIALPQRPNSDVILIMNLSYGYKEICFIFNLRANYYINKPYVPWACFFLLLQCNICAF
jgi:hypothetical protein